MTTETIHLTIPATFGYEDIPAAVAQVYITKLGGTADKADKAKLAVMEICLNAIEHGSNNDPTKLVSIDFFENQQKLVIEVSDSGRKNFTPVIPKEFPPHQSNRRGFGLYMAFKLVDELEFSHDENGTKVRLTIHPQSQRTTL